MWKTACYKCGRADCDCKSLLKRRPDSKRASSAKRGYGRKWRRLRDSFLADNPLCVHCLPDKVTQASDVDHIVRHKGTTDPLFWDVNNLQPLCHVCHSKKTAAENNAGARYVVAGRPGSGKNFYVDKRKQNGHIVWDYDAILQTVLVGHDNKANNPRDMIDSMEAMRSAFIKAIVSKPNKRTVWLIMCNVERARQVATTLNAQLINLDADTTGG
jgi:5-methylcytosine-specific restriction protein A